MAAVCMYMGLVYWSWVLKAALRCIAGNKCSKCLVRYLADKRGQRPVSTRGSHYNLASFFGAFTTDEGSINSPRHMEAPWKIWLCNFLGRSGLFEASDVECHNRYLPHARTTCALKKGWEGCQVQKQIFGISVPSFVVLWRSFAISFCTIIDSTAYVIYSIYVLVVDY